MNPRRAFLNHAGGLSAAGVLGLLGTAAGLGLNRSADAADYRALVCVFLNGGNDGNDTLVPTDAAYNEIFGAQRTTRLLVPGNLRARTRIDNQLRAYPGLDLSVREAPDLDAADRAR